MTATTQAMSDNTTKVATDAFVLANSSGALPVGSLGACQFYATASTFGGDATACTESTPALSTPSAPTVNQTGAGTPGATAYSYAIIAYSKVGPTAQSSATATATGNATLNGTNWNNVVSAAVTGSDHCNFIRTASSGTPNTVGLIGTGACGSTLADKGLAGDGTDYSTFVNSSAGVYALNLALGSIAVQPYYAVPGTPAPFLFSNGTVQGDPQFAWDTIFKQLDISANSAGYSNPVQGLNITTVLSDQDNAHGGAVLAGYSDGTANNGTVCINNPIGCSALQVTAEFTSAPATGVPAILWVLQDSSNTIAPPFNTTLRSGTTAFGIIDADGAPTANTPFWSIVKSGATTASLYNMTLTGAYITNGDKASAFVSPKNTAAAVAPGAGVADLRWLAGTNAGTCKLVSNAGTSATEVTIVDNVGGGC